MRELPSLLGIDAGKATVPVPGGKLVVAVDVGTASARAAVFDTSGRMLARNEHPIRLWRAGPDFAEHDSQDIWNAVCIAVRQVVDACGGTPDQVAAIGFDATCSLVIRGGNGAPVTVSPSGEPNRDTIVWLDHRALKEADECTQTGHAVLEHAGGVMSPEMQIPKLMWLKRHLPQSWNQMAHAFDLADFLTWMATGSTVRSQCTLTCKWSYRPHVTPAWSQDFFGQIGLDDLVEKAGLPDTAAPVANSLGQLMPRAAAELGLSTQCIVSTGLIDAYGGAIGVLGAYASDPSLLDRHMALIAGTSSCVMTMSPQMRSSKGVWGPYLGACIPGFWINEGGQSATGALLDHVIRVHSAGRDPTAATHGAIIKRIGELRAAESGALARRLHVLPDFHGNRSPLADPQALGVVSGLAIDSSFDGLCALYWRTAVAIALGVRHILESLNENGQTISTLHVTGGHTRNELLMELYADATGCTVSEPNAEDATLLGTAMAAACAAGLYNSLPAACAAMDQGGRERKPDSAAKLQFDRDYAVFVAMHRHRAEIERISGQ
ncbi:MAG: FGGY-family carbohydrate kinase [Rhizobiaceae bacterium]